MNSVHISYSWIFELIFENFSLQTWPESWWPSRPACTSSPAASVLVCTPFLANLLCFVSSFLKQKNQKIYQQFIKKIADPERRFVLPANTKYAGISCSRPQRGGRVGEGASLLKHGAAISSVSPRQATRRRTRPHEAWGRGCYTGEVA